MRLDAFRVQNYKKIRDTGWINCRDLTTFVGKNESGKSAIFRGLSKINPSDSEPYDGLKEFPRSRYIAEFDLQDWPAASARFVLDDDERRELAEQFPLLQHVTALEVTRHYSWNLHIHFQPAPSLAPATYGELRSAIDQAIDQVQDLTAPEGKGEELAIIKQTALATLRPVRDSAGADGVATKALVDQAVEALTTQANEEWQKQLLDPVGAPLHDLAGRAADQEALTQAELWVQGHLPKFVYFDRYDILDSAIHIPTFLQELQDQRREPRHRVTLCLFKHVGLDLHNMLALGDYPPGQALSDGVRRRLDELAIRANSASITMTSRFQDWWEQRRHRFRYDFQGEYFRIWVADDLDPSEIELDQRSQGLQYFFSFYLVFLVEAEGQHANSILLLDEPGLHVHGTAQAKIVNFLERLSHDNQTLYTTHSPFMVDVDHLERARAVYEHDDGTTKVSEDIWPRDRDSLFPLQAALGYQLAQGLFISKRQVIVEGLSDLWLLKALDQVMAGKGRTRLRPDLVIVPAAGVTKLLPLASMLIGHDIEVAALLDGDEPARREGRKLVEKLLAGEDRRCLFIGDFVNHSDGEIEDLFPEDLYLAAVRQAYPDVKGRFSDTEKALPRAVARIQALFQRRDLGHFEKWKPAAVLRDQILAAPDAVPDVTCDTIELIYQALNSLFTPERAHV